MQVNTGYTLMDQTNVEQIYLVVSQISEIPIDENEGVEETYYVKIVSLDQGGPTMSLMPNKELTEIEGVMVPYFTNQDESQTIQFEGQEVKPHYTFRGDWVENYFRDIYGYYDYFVVDSVYNINTNNGELSLTFTNIDPTIEPGGGIKATITYIFHDQYGNQANLTSTDNPANFNLNYREQNYNNVTLQIPEPFVDMCQGCRAEYYEEGPEGVDAQYLYLCANCRVKLQTKLFFTNELPNLGLENISSFSRFRVRCIMAAQGHGETGDVSQIVDFRNHYYNLCRFNTIANQDTWNGFTITRPSLNGDNLTPNLLSILKQQTLETDDYFLSAITQFYAQENIISEEGYAHFEICFSRSFGPDKAKIKLAQKKERMAEGTSFGIQVNDGLKTLKRVSDTIMSGYGPGELEKRIASNTYWSRHARQGGGPVITFECMEICDVTTGRTTYIVGGQAEQLRNRTKLSVAKAMALEWCLQILKDPELIGQVDRDCGPGAGAEFEKQVQNPETGIPFVELVFLNMLCSGANECSLQDPDKLSGATQSYFKTEAKDEYNRRVWKPSDKDIAPQMVTRLYSEYGIPEEIGSEIFHVWTEALEGNTALVNVAGANAIYHSVYAIIASTYGESRITIQFATLLYLAGVNTSNPDNIKAAYESFMLGKNQGVPSSAILSAFKQNVKEKVWQGGRSIKNKYIRKLDRPKKTKKNRINPKTRNQNKTISQKFKNPKKSINLKKSRKKL